MIASLCSEESSETGGHHRTGSAAEFYRELNRRCASDLDLAQVIQTSRQPNSGISLALPTITQANRGRLATRNTRDCGALPKELINPWALSSSSRRAQAGNSECIRRAPNSTSSAGSSIIPRVISTATGCRETVTMKETNKIRIVGGGFSGAVVAHELAEALAAADQFLQRKGRNEPIPSFFVKLV